jgi:tetratricopeptide (TPR) repeat protein
MTPSKIHNCIFLLLFALTVLNPSNRNNLYAEEDVKAIFQKAESLFNNKKFSEALSIYEDIISKDPSFIRGYRGIIECYVALGDAQGAVVFIESLFLENPESAEICYSLGYALYYTKKYNEAKIYFDRAIRLNPDLAAAWNNLAAIYHFISHEYENARAYYEKAIEISMRTGNDWVLKIAQENLKHLPKKEVLQPIKEQLTLEEFINRFISFVNKDDEKEIKQLVLGQKENCEHGMEWFIRLAMQAFAEGKKEDEKTAILLARLLEKEYRNSFKSNLLKRKFEIYNSLSDEKKNILIKGESLFNDGLINEKNGEYTEAINNYKEALLSFNNIKDKSRVGLTHLYLGDVYCKMKIYESARKEYHNGLSIFVETGEEGKKALVLSSLGRTCFLSGDYTIALQFLKHSLELFRMLKDETSAKKVYHNIELVMAKINKQS